MDKMVMAVIPRDEAEQVLDGLINEGHTATFLETRGGMLRQSQYTLFIAIKEEDLNNVCHIIKKYCTKNLKVDTELEKEMNSVSNYSATKIGGAIVFIWNIEKIENF